MKKSLIIIGLALIGLIWFFFSSGSQKTPDAVAHLKFDEYTRPEDKPLGEKAFNILVAHAGPLFKEYSGDINSITISVSTPDEKSWEEWCPYNFRCEKYGWFTIVEVVVTIKNDPQRIPNKFMANGHTLSYEMGGGKRPGMLTMKSQGQLVCGWPDGNGNNVFIDAPELNFIPGEN